MTIAITSLASLKRAMATPGVVLIMDESTRLAHSLQRDPVMMAATGMPRAIKEVRSNDFIVTRSDGTVLYTDFPTRDRLECDGGNSFTIIWGADDAPERTTYRIEYADRPYEPSRLALNHPPLAPDVIADEKAQAESAAQARDARVATSDAEYQRVMALPDPPADPRYETFAETIQAVMREYIGPEKPFISNDRLGAAIMATAAMQEAEFAEFVQGSDILLRRSPIPRESTAILHQAAIELAAEPRGSWRRVVHLDADGQASSARSDDWDSATVSLGNGKTLDVISYHGRLNVDMIRNRMLEHDVYTFRAIVEQALAEERAEAHLAKFTFAVGDAFRDVTFNRQPFSTATITKIETGTDGQPIAGGTVSLMLTKRGSAKRWTVDLSPSALASHLPAPDQTAAPAMPVAHAPAP